LSFLSSPLRFSTTLVQHPRLWSVGWEIFGEGGESNGGPFPDNLRDKVKRKTKPEEREMNL